MAASAEVWVMPKRKASIIMRRPIRGTTLYPVSAYDQEQLEAFPPGTEFDVSPRTRRSLPQMRCYWAALSAVVAATDKWATAEHLHDALVHDLGYVRVGMGMDGKPYITRDSTAFDAMKREEFGAYFDKSMKRLAEVLGFDPMAALDQREVA